MRASSKHRSRQKRVAVGYWVPAFAGMTIGVNAVVLSAQLLLPARGFRAGLIQSFQFLSFAEAKGWRALCKRQSGSPSLGARESARRGIFPRTGELGPVGPLCLFGQEDAGLASRALAGHSAESRRPGRSARRSFRSRLDGGLRDRRQGRHIHAPPFGIASGDALRRARMPINMGAVQGPGISLFCPRRIVEGYSAEFYAGGRIE